MEDSFDPDLTYECLIHDLNNVFETITEAAELLSSDRQWRFLAATLRRSVERGKRLVERFRTTRRILRQLSKTRFNRPGFLRYDAQAADRIHRQLERGHSAAGFRQRMGTRVRESFSERSTSIPRRPD